jgi:hypothetical protein
MALRIGFAAWLAQSPPPPPAPPNNFAEKPRNPARLSV